MCPWVPKAPGTARGATSMAAIAVRITKRAGITSSAGTALVSLAYPPHAHHSTASSAAPWIIQAQLRWSARKPVTWVRAKTKTRSKNKQLEGGDALLGRIAAFLGHAG